MTAIDMGSILSAYDCSEVVDGIKSQGMVLRVCVEPVNAAVLDGFRMQAIENFRYEKTISRTDTLVIQDAVVDRAVADALSRLTCVRGQVQCSIETMLIASFYMELGAVDAKGVATMQLGNWNGIDERRLRGNGHQRVLQPGQGLGMDEGDLPDTLEQEISVPFQLAENTELEYSTNGSIKNGAGSAHSLVATIGIIVLLILNIAALIVMIRQLPYFRGRRLYIS